MRTSVPALALLAFLALLVTSAWSPLARADPPMARNDPSSSSWTATWGMNNASGLDASGVVFNGGHAELPWVPNNVSWSSAAAFESAGTLDANLTALAGGIGLRYDPTNHIANPGFTGDGGWTYGDGNAGELNATWAAGPQMGEFEYDSPSTQLLWDPMDALGSWTQVAYGAANVSKRLNTTDRMQGSAALEIDCNFSAGSVSTAGLQNSSTNVNWSAGDQLVLWVYLNASAPLTFNISALDQSFVTRFTAAQPILSGWHEMTVDLGQLGSNMTRGRLAFVTLRVNGEGVPNRVLLFDDIRIGPSKRFTDAAYIRQSFNKANATTPDVGSALLSLRWEVANLSGVGYSAYVSLAGPGGSVVASLNASQVGIPWVLQEDVSAFSAPAGAYTLNVTVTASVNTTAGSELTAFLDDVSVYFPNRRDGAYTSGVIDLSNNSEFLNLTWNASTPSGTSAALYFRTAQGASQAPIWTPWTPWPDDVVSSLAPAAGRFYQVEVFLNTTDASASPLLSSFLVVTRHRAVHGSLASEPFTAGASDSKDQFLRWRNLTARWTRPAGAEVQFFVGNGSSWYMVQPGQSLGSVYLFRTIRWRADLNTSDALVTPSLSLVNLTWEYLGPVSRVALSPGGSVNVSSGQTVQFAATGYDTGDHVLPYTAVYWTTTDRTGNVTQNGLYTAGTPGTWNVTISVVGTPSIWASVTVRVSKSDLAPLSNPILPWLLGITLAAAAGIAVYEAAVRRRYAIDDVFVIGRDGRLLMHNTRRMRADRDEDVLSGMLTALISFLRDWDPEENGKARRFDYGDKIALLEHGEHVFVAAVYAGRVPRWAPRDLERFVEDLEAEFGKRFATWSGDPGDLHGLRAFVDRFAAHTRYHAAGLGCNSVTADGTRGGTSR